MPPHSALLDRPPPFTRPASASACPNASLTIRKDALPAVVHRPQHPDTRMKHRAATFGGHNQRLYSGLQVGQLLLSLGYLQDVVGRVLARPAAGNGIFERGGPATNGECLREQR
jgi:hypothetical protein